MKLTATDVPCKKWNLDLQIKAYDKTIALILKAFGRKFLENWPPPDPYKIPAEKLCLTEDLIIKNLNEAVSIFLEELGLKQISINRRTIHIMSLFHYRHTPFLWRDNDSKDDVHCEQGNIYIKRSLADSDAELAYNLALGYAKILSYHRYALRIGCHQLPTVKPLIQGYQHFGRPDSIQSDILNDGINHLLARRLITIAIEQAEDESKTIFEQSTALSRRKSLLINHNQYGRIKHLFVYRQKTENYLIARQLIGTEN